jgi:hypothetical protein
MKLKKCFKNEKKFNFLKHSVIEQMSYAFLQHFNQQFDENVGDLHHCIYMELALIF